MPRHPAPTAAQRRRWSGRPSALRRLAPALEFTCAQGGERAVPPRHGESGHLRAFLSGEPTGLAIELIAVTGSPPPPHVERDPMSTLERNAHRRVRFHTQFRHPLEDGVFERRPSPLSELPGDGLVDLGSPRQQFLVDGLPCGTRLVRRVVRAPALGHAPSTVSRPPDINPSTASRLVTGSPAGEASRPRYAGSVKRRRRGAGSRARKVAAAL